MSVTSALKHVLTRESLWDLAGARSFERGENYFATGQVMSLVEHAGKLIAMVEGTENYCVTLSVRDRELVYDCTCPMGDDGAFCKHCVAVGLAWLANGAETSPTKRPNGVGAPVVTLNDARTWLNQREKKELVEMLLDQAATDAHLRERLLLNAAKAAGKGANVAAIRKALARATRANGFVHYRAARDFSSGIDQVVDSIADLLQAGCPGEVIELSEYALGKVEQATLNMDDSDGNMGGILARLQELHLEACRAAKPEPESLAERLFDWEMRARFDTFYNAAAIYADVLGQRGLAAYRRRAEAAWERVPRLGPGQKDAESFADRYRISHIMETLARQSGDIEALVAIEARDLSEPYAYLKIAEIYRNAKQHDKAMDWAERGVNAFGEKTDSRLREFLADEYHRRKRHDEAMQLVWTDFAELTRLATYQKLKDHADRINQWRVWREKALVFIRGHIEQEKQRFSRKSTPTWNWNRYAPDHSLLVEIFLWENDAEAAWREAQIGGCSDRWWMQLATQREKDFPADTIPVYQKEVEALVNQKNNVGYEEAVKLLVRIRGLMARVRQSEQFAGYLTSVRTAHRQKRNFIALASRL